MRYPPFRLYLKCPLGCFFFAILGSPIHNPRLGAGPGFPLSTWVQLGPPVAPFLTPFLVGRDSPTETDYRTKLGPTSSNLKLLEDLVEVCKIMGQSFSRGPPKTCFVLFFPVEPMGSTEPRAEARPQLLDLARGLGRLADPTRLDAAPMGFARGLETLVVFVCSLALFALLLSCWVAWLLVGWLLVGWLAGCLAGWLAGWLACLLACLLACCFCPCLV